MGLQSDERDDGSVRQDHKSLESQEQEYSLCHRRFAENNSLTFYIELHFDMRAFTWGQHSFTASSVPPPLASPCLIHSFHSTPPNCLVTLSVFPAYDIDGDGVNEVISGGEGWVMCLVSSLGTFVRCYDVVVFNVGRVCWDRRHGMMVVEGWVWDCCHWVVFS